MVKANELMIHSWALYFYISLTREMCIVYYERKIKDVKDEEPKGLLRREKANLLVEEAVNTN